MHAPDGFAASVGDSKSVLVTAASIHTAFHSRMLHLFCIQQPHHPLSSRRQSCSARLSAYRADAFITACTQKCTQMLLALPCL